MDIQFNADKSYLLVVGKSYGEILLALSINGAPIVWANSLRYLGVKFVSDKRFNIDISQVMRKFYAAANAIFSVRTTLRSLYAIGRPSVCCQSVVCDVGAPYSGG